MPILELPPPIESLRERVAAYERERARLCRKLAAPVRDSRLRAVQAAVIAMLTVFFAFGLLAGREASTKVRTHDERPCDPNKPLPVVRLPK